MRTAKQVKKEITKKYNRNPDGWKAWVGEDQEHNINWIIHRDSQVWMIKEFQVNPYKTDGVGGRVKVTDPKPSSFKPLIGFGVRPLPEKKALELLYTESLQELNKKTSQLLFQIPPTPINKLNHEYILHGPIMKAPRNLTDLSYKQRKLENKLRISLLKLKKTRYPQLIGLYG